MTRFKTARCLAPLVILLLGPHLPGQAQPAEPTPGPSGPPVALWAADSPEMSGVAPALQPTLTPYLPDPGRATGAAMIICPGGGYGGLAPHEGEPIALWLKSVGISSFVLRYRHAPGFRHPIPLGDAQRAIRLVRARAADWGVDPARIGILGFSAGGHLASSAGTHFDSGKADAEDEIERASCRPDLMVLVYPVISMGGQGHAGSRKNLLGDNPDPALVDLMSNEKQVTKDTPPAFLIHGVNDAAVPLENSTMFGDALRAAGVPYELHLFEDGPHGFGLGEKFAHLRLWSVLCTNWLRAHAFAAGGVRSQTRQE